VRERAREAHEIFLSLLAERPGWDRNQSAQTGDNKQSEIVLSNVHVASGSRHSGCANMGEHIDPGFGPVRATSQRGIANFASNKAWKGRAAKPRPEPSTLDVPFLRADRGCNRSRVGRGRTRDG